LTGEDAIDNAADAAQTAIVADALASDLKSKRKGGSESCANCGAPLEGPYCFVCGQYDDDLRRPVWTLAAEVVEGLFSVDGRVWRTVPPLVVQPGVMTRRYLDGERARFVPPFRLYLVASLIFFLVVAFAGGLFGGLSEPLESDGPAMDTAAGLERGVEEIAQARQEAEAAGNADEARTLATIEESLRQAEAAAARSQREAEAVSSALPDPGREATKRSLRAALVPEDMSEAEREAARADHEDVNLTGIEGVPLEHRRWIMARAERIIDDPSRLFDAMERWAPRLLFVLVPVYALMLALMHVWRRDFIFYDHLIVSLHAHAFLFLLLSALLLSGELIGPGVAPALILIFLLWSNFYIYRLHRRVYGHGRISSVLRTLIIDLAYLVILSIALVALFALGVAFV